jgi:hypothetical protein
MSRKSISNFCAIPAAVFLVVIGLLHSYFNVSGGRRAMERGDLPARLGGAFIANALFSGLALSLMGLLVFLVLPGLRAGSRQAARVAIAIGTFVGVTGAAGFLWIPTKPSVLIFLFFGALLAVPCLVWRREFQG